MSGPIDITLDQMRRRHGAKWAKFGPDVLGAWVADMDFPVAEPVRQAVQGIVDRNDFGYPIYRPGDTLEAAFVGRMRERFQWEIEPQRVIPIIELIQAMAATVNVFSEPGDGIIVQTPIYPPFLMVVHLSGRRLDDNPLRRGETRFEMDLDALRATVDDRTRMLLLCNPHNPSGRAFERTELEALAELALERDLIVVSDEIHADLIYDGGKHIPFAMLGPEIAARTITITSATKAFNIAGLRCAVMHFGSAELQQRFESRIHPRILGVPSVVGIDATIAAWREGQPWLDEVMAQLDRNRAHVTEFLAAHLPEVAYRIPEATYLAWLDCSALDLKPRPWKFFLNEAKVALNDGREFSAYTEQCVRLNFATSAEILDQILTRMANAVSGAR